MSTVYVLEPPTKGKVVVNTTHGPIDVELWPKEAPKSVRNYASRVTSITPSSTVLFLDFSFKAAIPPAPERVTSDSIYNLLRLGEVDTSKDDRPLDPAPKLLSVDVLWNPFEDIVPRVLAKTLQESVAEIKEPQQKPVKKLNLLSFGEEAEEEEK